VTRETVAGTLGLRHLPILSQRHNAETRLHPWAREDLPEPRIDRVQYEPLPDPEGNSRGT